MAKKSKKKTPHQKAQAFSNRPFVNLQTLTASPTQTAIESPPSKTPIASSPTPLPPSESEEDFILSKMMEGALPIEHKHAEKKHRIKKSIQTTDDSELVMRQLDELVHGKGDFDIVDTEEYIEASIAGLDKRIIKKLRKGEYSVQAHIDLHGMTRDEARIDVAKFIEKSYKTNKKCVLIVHGRGLGSVDHIPVLKEKLRAWLTRGALGKKVLAYTSARPFDGGTGAVYVLLRS